MIGVVFAVCVVGVVLTTWVVIAIINRRQQPVLEPAGLRWLSTNAVRASAGMERMAESTRQLALAFNEGYERALPPVGRVGERCFDHMGRVADAIEWWSRGLLWADEHQIYDREEGDADLPS